LLEIVGDFKVKCITMYKVVSIPGDNGRPIIINYDLPIGYTEREWELFLQFLDFEYDVSRQLVDGTIWFDNGLWAVRNDTKNDQWWTMRAVPNIPKKLQQINQI
jgi:hypothetical protein